MLSFRKYANFEFSELYTFLFLLYLFEIFFFALRSSGYNDYKRTRRLIVNMTIIIYSINIKKNCKYSQDYRTIIGNTVYLFPKCCY